MSCKILAATLLLISPLCHAESSYWYYASERADNSQGKVIYKYSKILTCKTPISEGNIFKADFVGNDASGPFASYQEADAARTQEIQIAISAKKEIKLANAVCN
ncbi:hypothetical protein ACIGCM_20800 [Pseudomonas sp. NPDC078700]|uniref:hypothetical protein n=1 Tax=Pseudomonas sp. NPDC078700 TaxID=3364424 RepID=UPI0037C6D05D